MKLTLQNPLRWIGHLLSVLTDPARRERAMIAVLGVYTLLWACYGVIAKGSQDVHPDMAELFAWAREPSFGYLKHPPFAAWVVKLWFTVFPAADWSYYLLGAVTASVGLWIIWRLSARYLDAGKRVLAIALLSLIPFFGFHALKYNVNTVLIPLWAATTLCFLRSFETRSIPWAALAGVCAAAAMLGKYWSIFLLAGLALAALADSRRSVYFRSAAPWVTVAAGALVLAPHLAWLVAYDFAPFSYAVTLHGAKNFTDAAMSAAGYLAGGAGYAALPVVLVLIAARPSRSALAEMLWPPKPERRLIANAFWLPFLLPALAALATRIEINSLWAMSAWTLFPAVLLAPRISISRKEAVKILALAVAFPLVMLAASPFIANSIHRGGMPSEQTHASVLAPSVERTWRETTNKPLRLVTGDLAYQLAFYLPDRPGAFPDFDMSNSPWINEARIARDGIVMVCRASHQNCMTHMERRAAAGPAGKRQTVTIARRHSGSDGNPERYLIVTIPPK